MSEYDEIDTSEVEPHENESTKDEVIKKRSKKKRAKGLGHVADEIGEVFMRVAVSDTKLIAGAEKKEVRQTFIV